METDLKQLVKNLKEYPGLTRKQPVARVFNKLVADGPAGPQLVNYGDDAAIIPHTDGYLLMAADGIMENLLINEPYAAGKASVMVVVNDIYSMGGRPLAMVNVLASGEDEQRGQVVEGIAKGCKKLRVPMVGGHLHPDADPDHPHLSVAIMGWAQKLMRSHLAQAGDDLIVAVDLSGEPGCASVTSWDANSHKTSEELLARLEVLPAIAEQGLCVACKDISNGGLIGTAAIMMENSRTGAVIDLETIPMPDDVGLLQWSRAFMSYGFVMAASSGHTATILEMFRGRGITAEVVGAVTSERRVVLSSSKGDAELYDFTREAITGISRPPRKSS